jgi:hypothetical protein
MNRFRRPGLRPRVSTIGVAIVDEASEPPVHRLVAAQNALPQHGFVSAEQDVEHLNAARGVKPSWISCQ